MTSPKTRPSAVRTFFVEVTTDDLVALIILSPCLADSAVQYPCRYGIASTAAAFTSKEKIIGQRQSIDPATSHPTTDSLQYTNTQQSRTMPPPPDVILEALNEIIGAWKDENYGKVIEKCLLLSKRKKLMKDFGLTVPLQRLLLQAFLKDEEFDAVIAWAGKDENSTADNVHDLVLYAQYRKQEYAIVVRQAKSNNSDHRETMEHLTAQSHFHLHHSKDTLEAYSRMIDTTKTDDDDDGDEAKMELLTNAVAAIVSMASTPTVSLKHKHDTSDDETLSSLTEQAATLLEAHNNNGTENSSAADLASNFGLLQFLTDPTFAEENWLEVAEDLTLDENENDLALNTTLQWSQHFWYKDMEHAQYQKTANTTNLSVPQSIANFNQALLEENLQKVPPKPHPKWNPLQIKLYWYNRAILQFKAKQLVECQESCQSLRKLTIGGGATGGGGKKKKKKGDSNNNNADSKQSTSNDPADLWWEARVDVLLAHVLTAQSKQKDALEKLAARLESLDKFPSSSFTIDHAIAHVSLHRYMMEKGRNTKKADYQKGLLQVLKDLPQSIRALPGAYYTLGDLEVMVENAQSSNGKSKKAPKTPREEADVLFDQGAYEEACRLYKEALPSEASEDDAIVDSQLKFVQALAMTGQPEASQKLWDSLESSVNDATATTSLPDGEALEGKTLPRSSTGAARSALNKNLIANGGEGDDDKDGKPSRDKILRYRSRRREAYLKELEAKGQYNPNRPVQPNPERWLPKYERSRARNRNRGGNNRSAQGGVSEKDAMRLDAAARKAGTVPASSGPSTANMKVSGGHARGGRRR